MVNKLDQFCLIILNYPKFRLSFSALATLCLV